MTDQYLVAIYRVKFLVEQLSYVIQQTCNCLTKLVLCYILSTFPHKRGYFALSVDVFKKICQKLKSPNVYGM